MAQNASSTQKNDFPTINPVAAGVVGAAVGVAAATLARPENRKKVGTFIKSAKAKGEALKKQATKTVDSVRNEMDKARLAHETQPTKTRSKISSKKA